MQHTQSHFIGLDNIRIHFQSWRPPSGERGVVIIAHGLGEHGARYAHVARALVGSGCAVHALDHRGHGRSDGPRALIGRFEHAVHDIDQLVERAGREHAGVPLYLLGHSLGGALALAHALRHGEKLAGLVLSGPAVALDGAPPGMRPISRWLSAVSPRLGLFSIDPSLVSRDPHAVSEYRADPLNFHGRVPVGTLAAIVRFVESLPATLPMLKLPLLVMHGGADKLAGVDGRRRVVDAASSRDKTLKVYEGLHHEIFNELPADRARVLADLQTWLDARLEARLAA